VLNVDDPHVLAMQARCAGQVLTYDGLGPEAMVRVEHIRASWPERLAFTIRYAGEFHMVRTQLCGAHWMPCVLAALAVGITLGVPLATAVQAVHTVPPFKERMSPVSRPDRVTFIEDDAKAPLWSIPPVLIFMQEAKARQKVVVVGTISDYSGNSDRTYVAVARQALAVADHVVFVGSRASKCLKARCHPQDTALQTFYAVEAASEYLHDLLQSGDLVLLKGSHGDSLGQIIKARKTTWPQQASASTNVPVVEAERPIFAVVGSMRNCLKTLACRTRA
jgi:UDP-N-acetylmuramyl pentapeptide synthase